MRPTVFLFSKMTFKFLYLFERRYREVSQKEKNGFILNFDFFDLEFERSNRQMRKKQFNLIFYHSMCMYFIFEFLMRQAGFDRT